MATDDTIKRNRLWNMRQLVRNCGGVNEAARLLNRKNSYVTAICGPNPSRAIGDRFAAEVETAFGLSPGTLDMPPPKEMQREEDAMIAQICATLAHASDADKEFILHMAEWMVKRRLKSANASPESPIHAADVK